MYYTCHNNFKFIGKSDSIDELVKSNFSFSYFVPPPENAKYKWYEENWGTMYEANEIKLHKTNYDCLYIKCQTRWEMPLNFLKKLIEKFPDLYIFNRYSIALTDCGIYIQYMHDNKLVEKEFKWFDPFCIENIKNLSY
jgi:hypothetical protein